MKNYFCCITKTRYFQIFQILKELQFSMLSSVSLFDYQVLQIYRGIILCYCRINFVHCVRMITYTNNTRNRQKNIKTSNIYDRFLYRIKIFFLIQAIETYCKIQLWKHYYFVTVQRTIYLLEFHPINPKYKIYCCYSIFFVVQVTQ